MWDKLKIYGTYKINMSFLIPHRIIVLHYIKPHHKDGVYIKGLVMETYSYILCRSSIK